MGDFMNFAKAKRAYKIRKYSIDFLLILLGSALMAMGTSWFLLPNQLSSGGFSGIATITYYLLKLPMGTVIMLLNIPLFILSFFKIGKEFLIKSIVGTLSLSFFIDRFDTIYRVVTYDKTLACIYGGVLMGLGTAIILKAHASTGGTDLLANLVRKYKPDVRTSNVIVLIDIIIVGLNVLFFRKIEIGLYSAITIYLMGKIIDIVFEGIYFTKMVFIISDKYQLIAEKIAKEVQRGSTGIYAKGMYTNEEKMMLLCIASRGEAIQIKQVAYEVDDKAFLVISNAREAFGKGFK